MSDPDYSFLVNFSSYMSLAIIKALFWNFESKKCCRIRVSNPQSKIFLHRNFTVALRVHWSSETRSTWKNMAKHGRCAKERSIYLEHSSPPVLVETELTNGGSMKFSRRDVQPVLKLRINFSQGTSVITIKQLTWTCCKLPEHLKKCMRKSE